MNESDTLRMLARRHEFDTVMDLARSDMLLRKFVEANHLGPVNETPLARVLLTHSSLSAKFTHTQWRMKTQYGRDLTDEETATFVAMHMAGDI